MSQPVAISTVFRTVPNVLLRRWFDDHVPGQFPIKWDDLGEREVEPMMSFHNELPPSKRDEMDIDLQTVRAFASEAGMRAFMDAAELHDVNDLMQRIPDDLDLNGRAMWVRVNEPEIFKSSLLFLRLDEAQWWRCRNDVPQNMRIAKDVKERLQDAISDLLREDGRGQQTTVQIVKRGDCTYFDCNPDDYVRSENTHDESGNLMSIPLRPTTQVLVKYDAGVGQLQISTKIKQPRKSQIEQVVAKVALGWDLGPYSDEPAYELDHLKLPTFNLETDPSDNIHARIESIGLLNTITHRKSTASVRRNDSDDSIYRAIEEELGREPSSLHQLQVTYVEIKFQFPGTRYHRAGRTTIRITPRSCNLNRLTSDRAEIVQKHLKLWNIDNASIDQSGLG
ncbi:hypothetical protein [Crateriforma conspicua]|uniref:hypothetical protein n=1 Tax=Crateriforma conspicua TaxID=2527996 RepID=UPI001188BD1E|nr:hypothetical protein [Crateriforma conspicua]QDV62640.1 hypothetical protein Mal65_17740 [Crateriforma conspicua]